QGVTATIAGGQGTIKGAKGTLNLPLGRDVTVAEQDQALQVPSTGAAGARTRAGSTRAPLASTRAGVTPAPERVPGLVAGGARAAAPPGRTWPTWLPAHPRAMSASSSWWAWAFVRPCRARR